MATRHDEISLRVLCPGGALQSGAAHRIGPESSFVERNGCDLKRVFVPEMSR
ncbi:MAG TPA: hypothetical protein VES20_15875 [Bryobacteraceae bacterium]|nr:hypothetical protein [Bryobacteraceae bacterium]